MTTPILTTHRDQQGETAVLFVHGFAGDPSTTWGKFPGLLAEHAPICDWDIFSLGYATRLAPDLAGVWSADAPLTTLAELFLTACALSPLLRYKSLALVAHSMGGLIVQRALLDSAELAGRVGHVFLFGTPSAGLAKASPFAFLKRQIRDMARGSAFMTDLQARWAAGFGDRLPFDLWAVAGDQDEFVPRVSSIDPFPPSRRAVVPGNHFTIVQPSASSRLSVELVFKSLAGTAVPAGPWNAARVAVESREFQRAIGLLEPHHAELDEGGLVQLALALEGVGRSAEALRCLEARGLTDTDAMGVLAGRLKRRWLVERRAADAQRARQLYSEAFASAVAAEDAAQAYYHGINVAFMDLAYARAAERARQMARKVLEHCVRAPLEYWRLATEGEAYLVLRNTRVAVQRYEAAVAMTPKPRELESTYRQAVWVAQLTRNRDAEAGVAAVFRGILA